MSDLIFNGQTISQRPDSYVDVAQMAKASGKRFSNYKATSRFISFSNELAIQENMPVTLTETGAGNQAALIIYTTDTIGGINGAYVHPLIAIDFGCWCDAAFGVWCARHIKTLMETGSTQLVSEQPALPTALEIGKMFVAAETERLRLAAELEAAQPAIEFAKAIEASSNTVSMGEMAKMLGIGRTTFFGKLRQMKVIQQKDTLPYQQHLDSGYFEVTENTAGYPCARITGTGQTWLTKKFAKFELNLAKKEVAIEAIEQVWDCSPF